jgi:2-dehydro-3-deoxygluconokinase
VAKFVSFGEIMARMQPPGFRRIRQALPGSLEVSFAGSEANVAAFLAYLKEDAAFVTALPDNPLAEACVGALRNMGIDTSGILRTAEGRLGIYFVETGANQRPGVVTYDRDNSAFCLTESARYDWKRLFQGASWFHVSGITPAVSRQAAAAAVDAVKQAKAGGLTVSCDLNFRKKLWRWDGANAPRELARQVMKELLPHVHVVIGNEEDADDVLGIRAGQTDVAAGRLEVERYPEVASKIIAAYPDVRLVATTLRESVSASHNNWGAMLYEAQSRKAWFAPTVDGSYCPYQIRDIVDRVGAGDAFAAGLIYALNDPQLKDPARAVAFAAAASCLCHSVPGDFNYSSREEVLALVGGDVSGRVKR